MKKFAFSMRKIVPNLSFDSPRVLKQAFQRVVAGSTGPNLSFDSPRVLKLLQVVADELQEQPNLSFDSPNIHRKPASGSRVYASEVSTTYLGFRMLEWHRLASFSDATLRFRQAQPTLVP